VAINYDMIEIDDQPMSSRFFGEGKWLTEFVTPSSLEVCELHDGLTSSLVSIEDRVVACWQWVASEVKYKRFVSGTLRIENKTERQNDLWCDPSMTICTKVGNCANKAFLLASLIRRDMDADSVHCVLGNLYNGKAGGHAWVQVRMNDQDYIVEATKDSGPVMVLAELAHRYESVHLFNDQQVWAIKGRTVMEPYTACFSTWLTTYLDQVYIEGGK